MHSYKNEIIKLFPKVAIASLARTIILFYNTVTIEKKSTPEEVYETYKENHKSSNQKELVHEAPKSNWETEIQASKIIMEGSRSQEEKDFLTQETLWIVKKIDNMLQFEQKISNTIENITIKKEASPTRWYSNHNSIVLHYGTISHKEFMQLLTHELWHIIDLWVLQWESSQYNKQFTEFDERIFKEDDISLWYYTFSRESEYKKKDYIKEDDFCTLYGWMNPFEDFAECMQLYLYHHNYFKKLSESNSIMEQKYNYFKILFGGKYIENWVVNNDNKNINYRYWDSTKII